MVSRLSSSENLLAKSPQVSAVACTEAVAEVVTNSSKDNSRMTSPFLLLVARLGVV
jgi:hypothetical protein